jgi:hypothetical protein
MKNGLKGVTDAMVFCKSMKKGGTPPMVRSMKTYELGGTTDMSSSADSDCTYEMVGYPPKKVKKCPGNKMSRRKYNRSRRVPGIRN